MKKKTYVLLLCMGLLGVLTGCFRSVDELYALPKLPEEYQNLQAKIEEVTTGLGAEYAAPQQGTNIQPVQLQDLDGDGVMEAIAFFRITGSGEERPLRIYIFRLTGEGYEEAAVIQGEGSSVFSIEYENLNDSPAKELVVSWQAGGARTLSVYSIDHYEVTELMHSSYANFTLQDLDMDNRKEVALVRLDSVEGKNRVEFYDSEGDDLILRSSSPMSLGVTGLPTDGSIRQGYIRGEGAAAAPVPALFVTAYDGQGIVTDIFAWRDGALENITLEALGAGGVGGVSVSTQREKDDAKPTDINEDSYLELPMPVTRSAVGGASGSDQLYTWFQYDITGAAWPVFTTYHNYGDGWYFILPESWDGSIDVSEYSSTGNTGEKATVFAHRMGGEETGTPFLTIYKLTGPNRHMRARMGDRFILVSDDTTIYCAELTGGWDCGLDEDGVRAQFRQIKTEW